MESKERIFLFSRFHADDAFACAMLRRLPEYRDATILRSRDATILKDCDVLVDVGAVYDPDTFRFDHHQRSFSDTFSQNHKTRLSSAGLVYRCVMLLSLIILLVTLLRD